MQGSPASEIIDSLSYDLHDLSKRTTESDRPCQVTVSLASATVTSVRELGLCTRQEKKKRISPSCQTVIHEFRVQNMGQACHCDLHVFWR